MERPLKQRLIGGAVLVALAVILVPMLLHEPHPGDAMFGTPTVPPKPNWVPTPPRAATGPLPRTASVARPDAPVIVGAPAAPVSATKAGGHAAVSSATGAATAPAASPKEHAPAAADDARAPKAPASAPASSPPAAPAAGEKAPGTAPPAGLHAWVVQVASLTSESAAEALRGRLRKAGFAAFVERVRMEGRVLFRVRVGPELKRAQAQALLERLRKEQHLRGIVLAYP